MTLDARDLAAALLLDVDRRGARVKDLLVAAREKVVDPRERSLLTELAYGVVRRRSTLDAVLAPCSRQTIDRLQPEVLVGLRLATAQVLFLDRIPAHAAVNHAVGWVKSRLGAGAGGYANAVLRAVLAGIAGPARGDEDPRRDVPREDGSAVRLRDPAFADPEVALAVNLGARFACPVWLVERWLARFGTPRALGMLRAGIGRPPLSLRVRGDRDALLQELKKQDPAARVGPTAEGILLDAGEGTGLAAVREGRAAVQDATSQRVAPLLRPRPGQRLLDLCAAPGEKTLHLADLLGGRGEIVACDVDPRRVEGLARLAHVPAGVVVRAVEVPREGPLPFEAASFDGVLVDAPCSNTGVLRRRVEARWRVTAEALPALAAAQRGLLERALPLVRPGGLLVYSTCSTEPEENADVARAFGCDIAFDAPPSRDADGGFAAVIRVPREPDVS